MPQDTRLKDRNFYVVKSNDLIQRSRYSLTVETQRLILFAISKIKPDDPVNTWYEFSIKDVCNACGLDMAGGYYYTLMKNQLKKLCNREWGLFPDGAERTIAWLNDAEIRSQDGVVKVQFHPAMQPYLFELKERYTQYKLETVLAFKSKYTVRLYELLLSYIDKRKLDRFGEDEHSFSLEELRVRLDAEGYERYSNFKQKVLLMALEEINNYCDDIVVSFDELKSGRTVHTINFIVSTDKKAIDRFTARQNKAKQLNKDKAKQYRKTKKNTEKQ